MIENQIYRQRRDRVCQKIKGSALILFANQLCTRSNDTHFPFRQNSHFDYLTGFPEDQAILVLSTKTTAESYLFVQEKKPEKELWEGKKIGPLKAVKSYELDHSFSIDEFEQKLPEILSGHECVFVDLFEQKSLIDSKVYPALQKLNAQKKSKLLSPIGIKDAAKMIGQMRLIKSEKEIKLMRKACEISAQAHKAAMAYAQPGRYEYQVQALMEFIFKSHGANGAAYDSIVASGNNANTLHYISNHSALKEDELLLIDAGSEYKNYASDITRTFPIGKKFTSIQQNVYEIVLEAQKKAISKVSQGTTLREIHKEACMVLIDGLKDLQVLSKKSNSEIYEKALYRDFYPHGTSHWLGLDVHDQCPYRSENTNEFNEQEEIELKSGMVLTIEPGLYFSQINSHYPKNLQGIGVRIEDDILVTDKGHENLSQQTPKEVEDVEKACEQDYRSFLI